VNDADAPPRLFDRDLLLARRKRALSLGAETFLLELVAKDLAERLDVIQRRFDVAVDLGTPGDAVARALGATGKIGTVVACEPLAERRTGALRVIGSEEALPFAPESLDLVASALALQWVNDLPGTLVQIRRALRPDGLLLAALIGGDTLRELRECLAAAEAELERGASPRVAPFADVQTLGALLQRAGFALPVTDLDRHVVRYAHMLELLRDLRRMGATNILTERRRVPLRRATLMRAAALYGERYSDADGRIRATFEVISISGWAPHESQQKPLRPGSARTRLADALGVTERSAGGKADPRRNS
jgi:SAM-dependent methyltransferase